MPTYDGQLQRRFDDIFPAPYLTVRISWRGHHEDWPGLIDCGADFSMIPKGAVDRMGIEKASDMILGGVIGEDEERDTYVIDMDLPCYSAGAVEVAATRYPFVIVGRDVLNELVTKIDGPALTFALTAPDVSLTTSP